MKHFRVEIASPFSILLTPVSAESRAFRLAHVVSTTHTLEIKEEKCVYVCVRQGTRRSMTHRSVLFRQGVGHQPTAPGRYQPHGARGKPVGGGRAPQCGGFVGAAAEEIPHTTGDKHAGAWSGVCLYENDTGCCVRARSLTLTPSHALTANVAART